MIVASSYLPGEAPLSSEKYEVVPLACPSIPQEVAMTQPDSEYRRLLSALWGRGDTLCLVEHDVAYSDEHAHELEACEHDACAFPYLASSPDALVGAAHYDPEAVGGPSLNIVMGKPRVSGPEFAHHFAVGFAKVGPASQERPLGPVPWPNVAMEVNRCVRAAGLWWHLHWPGVVHPRSEVHA